MFPSRFRYEAPHSLDCLKDFPVLKACEADRDGMTVGDPETLIAKKPIIVFGVALERKVAVLEAIGRLAAVKYRFPEHIATPERAYLLDGQAPVLIRDHSLDRFKHWAPQTCVQLS